MRHQSIALSALALVIFAGCVVAPAPSDDEVSETSSALTVPAGVPYIGFGGYYGASSVALTFDDGPDAAGYTNKVLDILKSKGVHATFFINSENLCAISSTAICRTALRRMRTEGHKIGNHSANHYDFNDHSVDVWDELERVQTMLRTVDPSAPTISLTRVPFGNPFQAGPQSRLKELGPTVAYFGVHIGWSIDSFDWECSTGSCVRNNVFRRLDEGRRGIILMHSTHPQSVAGLPGVIDGIRERGIRFSSVESYVHSKYGQSSYTLMMNAR